jgi:DNA-binding XRE family transcriptional regulator
VNKATVMNWESGHTAPATAFYPAIIAFLGYNPLPAPRSPEEAVQRARLVLGWSQAELAARASVDPASVARVEADTKGTARRVGRAIRRALDLDGPT